MRVTIDTGDTGDTDSAFRPGNPERLIEAGAYFLGPLARTFDISPDGRRFLMIKEGVAASDADDPYGELTRLIVVQNWFQELNARVPVD